MYNCHFLDFIGQLFLLLAQRRPQFIVLCAPGVIKHRICKVLGLVVVTCLEFTIDWDDSWYLEESRTYLSFVQPILREEVYKVQSHKSCRCSVSLSPWTFDWSQGIWCRPSFRLPTLSKSFQRFCCKSKDVVVIQLHKLWNKRSNNLCMWQHFPNTNSAYCGSVKSSGHSGRLGMFARHCFQVKMDDWVKSKALKSLEVLVRCRRSSSVNVNTYVIHLGFTGLV